MHFTGLIDEWQVPVMAADLGLPAKNVRSWRASDSIPAEWFTAIERAARRRGKRHITLRHLAELAEKRRVARQEAQSSEEAA